MKFFDNQKIDDAGRTGVRIQKIIIVFMVLTVISMLLGSLIIGSIGLVVLSAGFFGAYKRCTCLLKAYAVVRIVELIFHFLALIVALVFLVFIVLVAVNPPENNVYNSYPIINYYFGGSSYGDAPVPPVHPTTSPNTNVIVGPSITTSSGSSSSTMNGPMMTTTTTSPHNDMTVGVTTTTNVPDVGVSTPGKPSNNHVHSQPMQPYHSQPMQPSHEPTVGVEIGYKNDDYYGWDGIIGYVNLYYSADYELSTSEIVLLTVLITAIVIAGLIISFAYYGAVFYTVVLSFRMVKQIKQSAAAYSAVEQKECQLRDETPPQQPFVYVVTDPSLFQMQNLA